MLQNVEDASDELILFDDDQMVPYPFVTDAGAFKTSGRFSRGFQTVWLSCNIYQPWHKTCTYEIGEVFVLLSSEEVQQKLDEYKLELQKELDNLKEQVQIEIFI